MDDELRKAAQDFADSVDGYENDLPLSAIRAKGALRAALAKNANAAPQDQDAHYSDLVSDGGLDPRNAAPDVKYGRPMVIGKLQKVAEGYGHHFEIPDALPDGEYEIVLRCPITDPRQAALEQVSQDCQWQASLDDKRDAERYRFMQGNESIKFWGGLGALHPSEWDEFIDAAMKEKS